MEDKTKQRQHMEIIDALILDCNTAIHEIINGNYVSWCNVMVRIVKSLSELKRSIDESEG